MQQQISVITLGVSDLAASRRFYREGFGWTPAFETPEIVFYQMNGLVLGAWLKPELEKDMAREAPRGSGAVSLAHNVESAAALTAVMDRLARAGGTVLRQTGAPLHGGFRGYIADPDGHAWEIAWNPSWPISAEGYVTFAL